MSEPSDRPASEQSSITQLLQEAASGDRLALNRLAEQIYAELHCVAAALMRHERPDHTLQPTALLHEAMARLLGTAIDGSLPNREALYAVATRTMRQVLVDHARRRKAAKRGGDWKRAPLDDAVDAFERDSVDLEQLATALEELEQLDPRGHRIIQLRFFGGLPVAEIAEMLDLSKSTVEKELLKARGFLYGRINV